MIFQTHLCVLDQESDDNGEFFYCFYHFCASRVRINGDIALFAINIHENVWSGYERGERERCVTRRNKGS